jgi:hypothetical protein
MKAPGLEPGTYGLKVRCRVSLDFMSRDGAGNLLALAGFAWCDGDAKCVT